MAPDQVPFYSAQTRNETVADNGIPLDRILAPASWDFSLLLAPTLDKLAEVTRTAAQLTLLSTSTPATTPARPETNLKAAA